MKTSISVVSIAICVFSARSISADTWGTGTSGTITSGTSTRVGIGFTSPAAQLDIRSNTANREGLIVNQVQNGAAIARFRQNGTTKVLISNDGTLHAASIEGNGVFPVTAFGAVPNDPLFTDYTDQFRAALLAAAPTGGTVLVPPGQFTINNPLTIPRGVTLKGSWEGPHDAILDKGTTLMTNAGNGNENGTPFITLEMSAAIVGVTIYYPMQSIPSVSWTPVQFPWTIRGTFSGTVRDITLANSYRGIDFATLSSNNHLIQNVNMTAIMTGIAIDKSLDVGRMVNVQIHPQFWARAAGWFWGDTIPSQVINLNNFTNDNLYAFKFGFADWENVVSCFAIWARVGMYFYRSPDTYAGVEELPSGQFVNCGIDLSTYAILIEEVQSKPLIGANFSNCRFVGSIVSGASNSGPVTFSNCSFMQYDDDDGLPNMITWDGSGTIALSNSSFGFWGLGVSIPAINLINGVGLINNCDFESQTKNGHFGAPKPALGVSATAAATFTGNRIRDNIESAEITGSVVNKFGSITR